MAIITKADPTDNPSGALIGYNNLLTATTTLDAESALTPNTYERFRPLSGLQTIKYQLPTSASVDFIGIAAHALAGETVTVSTATTVGGALTTVEVVTFTDNAPIMLTFDARTIREVALAATLSAGTEIGVVYAGTALQMPRNIYGGHSPINLSQQTETQSTMSESGQFLGRNIIRKGLETSFSWQLLDDQFIRNTFKPFMDSARTLPFFMKWRPDFYSNEDVFGYTTGDISPSNMGGGHRLMSVGFTMRGHSDL